MDWFTNTSENQMCFEEKYDSPTRERIKTSSSGVPELGFEAFCLPELGFDELRIEESTF
jgi:hypothetical protein